MNRRILCIEDNPINWRLVQRLLGQAGYEMHWAEEGLRGYEMALELRPDLVLLDINLPGLSGFEIATKFRQHPELKGMLIVALTAKTLKSDRETALVAGCDGFIPKPIDPFTFVDQVGAYLGGQRERVEEAREGEVLRSFNVQMLEHLESQLREAQEANRKLVETQQELEVRNRSLARLLAFGQGLLAEHHPRGLMARVLDQMRRELEADRVLAYRLHPSGGYWEGLQDEGNGVVDLPILARECGFCSRLPALAGSGAQPGDRLQANRIWDEGVAQGFWRSQTEPCLLALPDRQGGGGIWGFWVLLRDVGRPFRPLELELVALHASLAQVGIENAELIASLNESSRALASSYERMENAYQDLQAAKAALSRQERQGLMEELFLKIAQRLAVPVRTLGSQSDELDRLLEARESLGARVCEEAPKAIAQIRHAVGTVDGLLKALLRRVDKETSGSPEWLRLHDLLSQELELLEAEEILPAGVQVGLDLQSSVQTLFGVYADFARLFLHLVQHACGGPDPSPVLKVATRFEEGHFVLRVEDQGGPIPDVLLAHAFEPFSELHQQAVMGIRSPGAGLPHARQLVEPYHGGISLTNEGEGTRITVRIPLGA